MLGFWVQRVKLDIPLIDSFPPYHVLNLLHYLQLHEHVPFLSVFPLVNASFYILIYLSVY